MQNNTPQDDVQIFTAAQLLAMPIQKDNYLMEPILPRVGTAVLAAPPDTGKSQWARQLAVTVAAGRQEFLGMTLTPKHRFAIYVATEDDPQQTQVLLDRQTKSLAIHRNVPLVLAFSPAWDAELLVRKLKRIMNENGPADLIVIDSFGDVFAGLDMNSSLQMRQTVQMFNALASQYGSLILFVHHTVKSSYDLSPRQQHISGGAGLVQKVRLALQLEKMKGGMRHLYVTKGNYCPGFYKERALPMRFSEETFVFESEGEWVETEGPGSQPVQSNEWVKEKFAGKMFTTREFVEAFKQQTGKSDIGGQKLLKLLTDSNFLQKGGHGLYSLSDNIIP